MNWDQIEGNWTQFKGRIRERWGMFTEDDLDVIKGKREQFVGRLQEKYGIVREEAELQLRDFLDSLDSKGVRCVAWEKQ